MAGRLTQTEQQAFDVDSYYNRSTSRVKASCTLYVSFKNAAPPVPTAQRALETEKIFGEQPGFCAVRQVRGTCFVDFDGIKASTAAMMKFQGQTGLTLDYDKDLGVATKRQRESTERTERAQTAAGTDRR